MLLTEEFVYNKSKLIHSILALALLILFATLLLTLQNAFSEKLTLYDSENPPLTKEEVGIYCDASEDYEKNKEECDLMYEEAERNKVGDHWVGGITLYDDPDADRESDLGYNELCDYNGGKWEDNKCEFDDDEKEKKYLNKLGAYHDINPEKLKEDLNKQDKGQFEVVKCDNGIIYDPDSTNCDEQGKGYEFVICNGVEYPERTDCDDLEKNID